MLDILGQGGGQEQVEQCDEDIGPAGQGERTGDIDETDSRPGEEQASQVKAEDGRQPGRRS